MNKIIQVGIPLGSYPQFMSRAVMQSAIDKLEFEMGLPGKIGEGVAKYLNYTFDPTLMNRSVVSHIARNLHIIDGYVYVDLEIMPSLPGKFLDLLTRGNNPIDFVVEGVGILSGSGEIVVDYTISTVTIYPVPSVSPLDK